MELITILLSIVSILAVVSGLAILFGVEKNNRAKAAIFFVGNLSALVWTFSIVKLLTLPSGEYDLARILVPTVYISVCLMMSTLVGYFCYDYKIGKPFFILTLILTAIVGTLIITNPEYFYSGMVIDGARNRLSFDNCVLYYVYIGICVVMVAGLIGGALGKIFISRRDKRMSTKGYVILAIGLGLTGSLAGIFDLAFPLLGNYSLIWVGPLSMSAAILFHYYVVLRFRILELAGRWLKALTHVVMISIIAVVYMCVFFFIFSTMFRGTSPSQEVLLLNFIMAIIMILLVPAYNETSAELGAYVSSDSIDLPYIVKKLGRVKSSRLKVEVGEIATFLANHLHLDNVWILKGDRLWDSHESGVPKEAIAVIQSLGRSENGIWQEIPEKHKKALSEWGIRAVAELRDSHDEPCGQIAFGKSISKTNLLRSNLSEIEIVARLVGDVISKSA